MWTEYWFIFYFKYSKLVQATVFLMETLMLEQEFEHAENEVVICRNSLHWALVLCKYLSDFFIC